MLRHLLDLCRKSEKTGTWQYSGFLSPAEQDDFLRSPEAGGFSFFLTGGYENAERKILAAGNEEEFGPAEPPVTVIEVRPKSEKYAEELTHRDYLGAILGLGIERGVIGDILVRGKGAWFLCLSSVADLLTSALTQVRRTTVFSNSAAKKANPSGAPANTVVGLTSHPGWRAGSSQSHIASPDTSAAGSSLSV